MRRRCLVEMRNAEKFETRIKVWKFYGPETDLDLESLPGKSLFRSECDSFRGKIPIGRIPCLQRGSDAGERWQLARRETCVLLFLATSVVYIHIFTN